MRTLFFIRSTALLLALLAAVPAILAAQPAELTQLTSKTPAPAPPQVVKHPTLITTFSGGISLGAYQAGVDWALLEFYRHAIRDPAFAEQWRLPSFSFGTAAGASAGNINALLWAIETCTRQEQGQPPEESLFWKVWTNIDIENLLPAMPGDSAELALLDRGFIDAVYQTIEARTRSGRLESPCKRPLGITLTRVLPETLHLGNIPFQSQRYVVPLLASVTGRMGTHAAIGEGGRRIAFTRPTVNDQRLGPVRHPPRAPGTTEVPLDNIFPVVKASSAFPVAFQPVVLQLDRDDEVQPAPEMFVDGGLFDNNPVDLALVLHRAAGYAPDTLSLPTPYYQLLYVDPDNLRLGAGGAGCTAHALRKPSACPPPPDPAPGGLRPVLRLMSGAFSSAREYELFALSRTLPADTLDWQLLTTRRHPVVGKRLAAFGAFLNRAYREYDFYVGVYDAIHFVLCEAPGRELQPERDPARCTLNDAMALRNALPLSPAARQLVERLARAEFGESVGGLRVPRTGARDEVTGSQRAVAAIYARISEALELAEREVDPGGSVACASSLSWSVACLDGTHRFLGLLRRGLLKEDPSACGSAGPVRDEEMKVALEGFGFCGLLRQREDEYFQVYFDRLMRRLVQVERDVDDRLASERAAARVNSTGGPPMQQITEGLAFLYQSSSLRPHVGWRWGGMPMEARTAWQWAPSYAAVDAHWDGADLGWQPVWYSRTRPGLGVAFPVAVRWNNPVGNEWVPHWYYMVGAKVVVRNPHAWWSLLSTRAEAGVLLFQPSRDLWDGRLHGTIAVEVNGVVLADRLRVGVRTSLLGDPVDGRNRMQFSLGLNDVNGLGYWLEQIFRR